MPITDTQAARLKIWREHGGNYTSAAEFAGVARSTFTESIKSALAYEAADPGLQSAMDVTGLGGGIVTGGWRSGSKKGKLEASTASRQATEIISIMELAGASPGFFLGF